LVGGGETMHPCETDGLLTVLNHGLKPFWPRDHGLYNAALRPVSRPQQEQLCSGSIVLPFARHDHTLYDRMSGSTRALAANLTDDPADGGDIVKPSSAAFFAGLFASAAIGLAGIGHTSGYAAKVSTPAISEDASSALARMSATLQSKAFSFQARTLRVSANNNGELLHIGHNFKVTVGRPDHLLVDGTGDDGPRKLFYDGKTATVVLDNGKKYASLPVPPTIEGMLHVVVGRFGVDFPLADFLTDAPDKAFLTGVTAGRQVGTAMIDGVLCRHLVFSQPPNIGLELWIEDNDASLPRRLIVSYRSLPGAPNFVAEFSDWRFAAAPPDAEFRFDPPAGAEQLQLVAALKQSTGVKK
jgi:hypothetical protein